MPSLRPPERGYGVDERRHSGVRVEESQCVGSSASHVDTLQSTRLCLPQIFITRDDRNFFRRGEVVQTQPMGGGPGLGLTPLQTLPMWCLSIYVEETLVSLLFTNRVDLLTNP